MNQLVRNFYKNVWRYPYRKICQLRLKNKNVSLISSNCIGGGYYHDTFSQFLSPTINLTIINSLDFFENIEHFLSIEMVDGGFDQHNHPLGILGDVIICGNHYKDFESLRENWNKRKTRVNFDNIFIISQDEFIKTEEDMKRFDKLAYPKVCFVAHKADLKYDWQIYLPEFEKCDCCGDSMVYRSFSGKRINEKHFDFVYWLNNKKFKNR